MIAMPDWGYDEAVQRRVRMIELDVARHRVVRVEKRSIVGDLLSCACGLDCSRSSMELHLQVVGQEAELPPGVDLRT